MAGSFGGPDPGELAHLCQLSRALSPVGSNRVIYTVDNGVHFRMAKGRKGSLSKMPLGTQEFSLLSLAQVRRTRRNALKKDSDGVDVLGGIFGT